MAWRSPICGRRISRPSKKGIVNLERHIDNVRDEFGLPCVVSINHRAEDTEAEIELLIERRRHHGVKVILARHFAEGGKGAVEVWRSEVVRLCEQPNNFKFVYEDSAPLWDKMKAIATKIYHAARHHRGQQGARADQASCRTAGYGHYPVCVAKTQYSFSTDPKLRGAPSGHVVNIREVRLAAGAEFVVMICGDIMTMPGLPKVPAANNIDVDSRGPASSGCSERARSTPRTRVPFCEADPWRLQYFSEVPCPPAPHPDGRRTPSNWNPRHRWVYDKLLVAQSQGLPSAPHCVAPLFPVFSKPITNLRGMGVGSRLLRNRYDFRKHCKAGDFWMKALTGSHLSSDWAVVGGEPQWCRHAQGIPGPGGTFDYWIVEARARPGLERLLPRLDPAQPPRLHRHAQRRDDRRAHHRSASAICRSMAGSVRRATGLMRWSGLYQHQRWEFADTAATDSTAWPCSVRTARSTCIRPRRRKPPIAAPRA